jgi:hypothetical protein
LIIPTAIFLGPVTGSYSRVLTPLRPTAEVLTGIFSAASQRGMEGEMVGWGTWSA